MTTTRNDSSGLEAALASTARGAALTTGVVLALAAVALVLFFAVGGPFGAVNDGLNAVGGVASTTLALLGAVGARHPVDRGAALLGALGGCVFAFGSYLVLTDSTGWFLAGLVSGVGAGLVGLWLLVSSRRPSGAAPEPSVLTLHLGRAAGAIMALGLLALPSVVTGVDDWAAPLWHNGVAMLGWLGTYLLYPLWCLRTSRDRRE